MNLLEKISNNKKAKNTFEKRYQDSVKPFLNDNEYFYFEIPTINNNIELSESELKKLLCIESESESESESEYIFYFDLDNFVRILLKEYLRIKIDNSDFDINLAFDLLELDFRLDFEKQNYHIVKCNSELIDFLNIRFLYYKKNHNLKYDKYSVFFTKKNIYFDSFVTESYIISIVLNDNINTYLIFNDNESFIFKKIIANVLKLNFNDILNKKNLTITKKESELISNLDYSILGITDIDLNSLNSNKKESELKNIIFYYESKLNDLDNRFKRLIKVPIRNKKSKFSNYELRPLQNKLKNNRKTYNKILSELESLYESLYKSINYESKYESNYFNNLLLQNKSNFSDYENFNYSKKELELFDLVFKTESESESESESKYESESKSKELINLVYSLH